MMRLENIHQDGIYQQESLEVFSSPRRKAMQIAGELNEQCSTHKMYSPLSSSICLASKVAADSPGLGADMTIDTLTTSDPADSFPGLADSLHISPSTESRCS